MAKTQFDWKQGNTRYGDSGNAYIWSGLIVRRVFAGQQDERWEEQLKSERLIHSNLLEFTSKE